MMPRHVSKPMKSASVNGPIGTFVPNFIPLSISSAEAMPSCSTKNASLIYGMRMRFTTKPGMSLSQKVGVFPMASHKSRVRCLVSSLVARPRITSTPFMTGTGFMKCMPITFSGCGASAAIFVMEMDEVFEAKIAESLACAPSAWNTDFFTSNSSFTASTIKSALPTTPSWSNVAQLIRLTSAPPSSSLSLPLLTSFLAQSCTNFSDRSRPSENLSTKMTVVCARAAATIPIPVPI
mmetsp:Transcript_27267/g.65699  ORF Transcript_27267/g.65699 Transcript_27267/m.65699 type:complete len:236 (-) Transcript_27267:106-813(-)